MGNLLARVGADDALINRFTLFLEQNILGISTVSFVILFPVCLANYSKAKKLASGDLEEEGLFQKIDNTISLVNFITVLSSILFLMYISVCLSENYLRVNLVYVFLLTAYMMFFPLLQIFSINFGKKLNPEKKGDPGSFSFDKDWLSSCDEAERFTIYAASYQSFITLKLVFPLALLALIILRMFSGGMLMAIFMVCLLWAIHATSYYLKGMELSRNKLPQ